MGGHIQAYGIVRGFAEKGIQLGFIAKGKPTQNGFIESFNGKMRKECLDRHIFRNLVEAKEVIMNWASHYNEERPHRSLDFMKLQMNAKFILTDSGGIQEESTFFGVPCLTLRENTERPITITEGTNQLVPLNSKSIVQYSMKILQGEVKKGTIPKYWDGKTADRVVTMLDKWYGISQ